MSFCHNCGARLPEGARFCTSCGTRVPVAVAPTGPLPAEGAHIEPPTTALPLEATSVAPYPPTAPVQPSPHPTMTQPTFAVATFPEIVRNRTILIIAAVVAVVLVAGATTAFLALNRPANVATCLIGSWWTTSYIITATEGGDSATTTVTGLHMQFKGDGTTQQDFANVTTRTNDGEVHQLSGTVEFKYTVDGDTIAYREGRGQNMSEPGWDIDYTETAVCDEKGLTLTGKLDRDAVHSEWTTALTRE
jgi:hypothetical protein